MKSVLAVAVYGRYLGGYLFENIEDYLHGVEGGEYRHAVLDGTAADLIFRYFHLAEIGKIPAGENAITKDTILGRYGGSGMLPSLSLPRTRVRMPCFLRNAAVPAVASILKPR